VIGIDADEAGYLAGFLDRDECAQRGPAQLQLVPLQQDMTDWNRDELPGQMSEQFASWPPGLPSGADQPPPGAERHRARRMHLISGFTAAS
jgi:hypothetical protein